MKKIIFDKKVIEKQYKNDDNLNARISIYDYSEDKKDWGMLCFDKMDIPENSSILELGCGNGILWERNADRIKDSWDITLSDLSEGMLESAERNLQKIDRRFKFKVTDIQNIPYDNESFDVVIAKHMLYYVPDINKALSEVKRVLKPNGSFFATTNGRDHLRELKDLVKEYDSNIQFGLGAKEFEAENGLDILRRHFDDVSVDMFYGKLIVPDAEPIVKYVCSTIGNANEILVGDRFESFKKYVKKIIETKGPLNITTAPCIFLAAK